MTGGSHQLEIERTERVGSAMTSGCKGSDRGWRDIPRASSMLSG